MSYESTARPPINFLKCTAEEIERRARESRHDYEILCARYINVEEDGLETAFHVGSDMGSLKTEAYYLTLASRLVRAIEKMSLPVEEPVWETRKTKATLWQRYKSRLFGK